MLIKNIFFIPGYLIKVIVILVVCYIFSSTTIAQLESELMLEGASVTSIVQEGENIWVGTYGQGVFRYSKKENKWFNYSTRNSGLDNDLIHTLAANKDFVWVGTTEGLVTLDRKRNQWRKRKFAQGGEFGNWIRSLFYDEKSNVLWIGRFRNVTYLDVTRQRFTDRDLTISNDPKTNTIISIRADGDSVIWFGSEAGAHRYNKKLKPEDARAWQFISNKRGGFNGEGDAVSVSDFAFDNQYVWFGTDEFVTQQQPQFNIGGVYRYNRKLFWQRFSRAQGLAGNGIFSLERTGNYIWAGLYEFSRREKKEYGKGLVIINRISDTITSIDLNQIQTKSAFIKTMFFDGQDMWLGTTEGLVKIKITNPLATWSLKKEKPKTTKQQKLQKK